MNQQRGWCDEDRARQAMAALVSDPVAEELADLFAALADPTRVRMISALSQVELCVGDLAACLGMSISAVSHQLRTLRDKRLVRARREGRHVYYVLDDEHVRQLFRQGLEHAEHGEPGNE